MGACLWPRCRLRYRSERRNHLPRVHGLAACRRNRPRAGACAGAASGTRGGRLAEWRRARRLQSQSRTAPDQPAPSRRGAGAACRIDGLFFLEESGIREWPPWWRKGQRPVHRAVFRSDHHAVPEFAPVQLYKVDSGPGSRECAECGSRFIDTRYSHITEGRRPCPHCGGRGHVSRSVAGIEGDTGTIDRDEGSHDEGRAKRRANR